MPFYLENWRINKSNITFTSSINEVDYFKREKGADSKFRYPFTSFK